MRARSFKSSAVSAVNGGLGLLGVKLTRAPKLSLADLGSAPSKVFRGKQELVRAEGGYWRLADMPTASDLNAYYGQYYWREFRSGANENLLRRRDVEHLKMLDELLGSPRSGSFLNFGAGHIGVSWLLADRGWDVVNLDPMEYRGIKVEGMDFCQNLDEVDGTFDLIYSSHSLEHVTDIAEVQSRLCALLKPGGHLFVEVPNESLDKHTGHQEPPFVEPHTYYFTREFFEQWPLEVIHNSTYQRVSEPGRVGLEVGDDTGTWIRCLLRKQAEASSPEQG